MFWCFKQNFLFYFNQEYFLESKKSMTKPYIKILSVEII